MWPLDVGCDINNRLSGVVVSGCLLVDGMLLIFSVVVEGELKLV